MNRILLLFVLALNAPLRADDAPPEPETIASLTENSEHHTGLLTLHLDHDAGAIWLELPAPDERGHFGQYIYVESLRTGLGSNPVGLDRGQLGDSRLVTLREIGNKLFVEQENLGFRALSDDPAERAAVRESFAPSVLWAGEIKLRDPDDGRRLVDISSFLSRDATALAASLDQAGQGSFKLDASRSAVDTRAALVFEDNVELEALVTFTSDKPGAQVRGVAAEARALTFVVHHSLIRLPDDEYAPRVFDPRLASFSIDFLDYAAGLNEPVRRQWIARHRLEKTDPSQAVSPVKAPIVYYVDAGAPEPVRSALVEGANWWAEAFEKAGFEDAYRVEVMPEGAHPLDVRYNVIQWVHRSTRGWSYGGSIKDPRTGEIIKGHVSLGSLRVRQDRLLFEGLAGTDATGTGGPDDPVILALSRIRQLAAHEVGHTLGFAHNFAASTWGRASVMDYPAPWVTVTPRRELDFSQAYDVGIGQWDIHAVRRAYSESAPGTDEVAALEDIARDGLRSGYLFLSDRDARAPGSAHPLASLWDNGGDPIRALGETMRVRSIALSRFGAHNIRVGMPLSHLHEVFVPVYFHHRYQVEAASKTIGGLEYTYAVRGDTPQYAEPVRGTTQRRALEAVLETIDPAVLDVREETLTLLMPRAFGDESHRELQTGRTAPAFDALAAARAAADLTIGAVLDPARCARLVDQHRRDKTLPSLDEVLAALRAAAFPPLPAQGAPNLLRESDRRRAVRHAVQRVLVERLIALSQNPRASAAVRAEVHGELNDLALSLIIGTARTPDDDRRHERHLTSIIRRHLDRPFDGVPIHEASDPVPPGSPIGHFAECACGE